jgi:transposase
LISSLPTRKVVAIVANTYAYVIGVDAHAMTRTFAAVESRTGAVLATSTFPATATGISRALAWGADAQGATWTAW